MEQEESINRDKTEQKSSVAAVKNVILSEDNAFSLSSVLRGQHCYATAATVGRFFFGVVLRPW